MPTQWAREANTVKCRCDGQVLLKWMEIMRADAQWRGIGKESKHGQMQM